MPYGDDCPRSRDIDNLESKVDNLDYDIRSAKDDLSQDIRDIRSDLRDEIQAVRQDQNSDREDLEERITALETMEKRIWKALWKIEEHLGMDKDDDG